MGSTDIRELPNFDKYICTLVLYTTGFIDGRIISCTNGCDQRYQAKMVV